MSRTIPQSAKLYVNCFIYVYNFLYNQYSNIEVYLRVFYRYVMFCCSPAAVSSLNQQICLVSSEGNILMFHETLKIVIS